MLLLVLVILFILLCVGIAYDGYTHDRPWQILISVGVAIGIFMLYMVTR